MKKIIITIGVVTVLALVFVSSKYRLSQAIFPPSPEFPSAGEYKPLVTADDRQWSVVSKDDAAGNLVYFVKLPKVTDDESDRGYVDLHGDDYAALAFLNKVKVSSESITTQYKNIDEYGIAKQYDINDGSGYYGQKSVSLGKYRAFLIHKSDRDYVRHTSIISVLLKGEVLTITLDYPNGCLDWKAGDPVDKGQTTEVIIGCQQYFKVYMPIVEKILSMLSVPGYIDDRGFDTSNYSLENIFDETL